MFVLFTPKGGAGSVQLIGPFSSHSVLIEYIADHMGKIISDQFQALLKDAAVDGVIPGNAIGVSVGNRHGNYTVQLVQAVAP